MRILRRATDAAPTETAPAPAVAEPPAPVGGKGRPTPKRREAQARRRTPVAPANRKEAAKLARAESRDRRRAARAALASGDERHLPARDAGPVRRYARDFVDSRRNVGGLFLPVAVVFFVMISVPVPALKVVGYFLWLAMLLALIIDSTYLAWTIRSRAAARFPGEGIKGIGLYAAMRGMQFRRLRLPPPRVARGAKV